MKSNKREWAWVAAVFEGGHDPSDLSRAQRKAAQEHFGIKFAGGHWIALPEALAQKRAHGWDWDLALGAGPGAPGPKCWLLAGQPCAGQDQAGSPAAPFAEGMLASFGPAGLEQAAAWGMEAEDTWAMRAALAQLEAAAGECGGELSASLALEWPMGAASGYPAVCVGIDFAQSQEEAELEIWTATWSRKLWGSGCAGWGASFDRAHEFLLRSGLEFETRVVSGRLQAWEALAGSETLH